MDCPLLASRRDVESKTTPGYSDSSQRARSGDGHTNRFTMKTASLGLLEVMVVCVNAGGDAP